MIRTLLTLILLLLLPTSLMASEWDGFYYLGKNNKSGYMVKSGRIKINCVKTQNNLEFKSTKSARVSKQGNTIVNCGDFFLLFDFKGLTLRTEYRNKITVKKLTKKSFNRLTSKEHTNNSKELRLNKHLKNWYEKNTLETKKLVQEVLRDRNLYSREIDGKWGEGTRAALRNLLREWYPIKDQYFYPNSVLDQWIYKYIPKSIKAKKTAEEDAKKWWKKRAKKTAEEDAKKLAEEKAKKLVEEKANELAEEKAKKWWKEKVKNQEEEKANKLRETQQKELERIRRDNEAELLAEKQKIEELEKKLALLSAQQKKAGSNELKKSNSSSHAREWTSYSNDLTLQQKQFCQLTERFSQGMETAMQSGNQIKVNMVHKERQENFDGLLPDGVINNWIFKVVKIEQVEDGSAAVVLKLQCKSFVGSGQVYLSNKSWSAKEKKEWRATIPYNDRRFRELAKLDKGQFVLASGVLLEIDAFKPGQTETFYASQSLGEHPLTRDLNLEGELFIADLRYIAALN